MGTLAGPGRDEAARAVADVAQIVATIISHHLTDAASNGNIGRMAEVLAPGGGVLLRLRSRASIAADSHPAMRGDGRDGPRWFPRPRKCLTIAAYE